MKYTRYSLKMCQNCPPSTVHRPPSILSKLPATWPIKITNELLLPLHLHILRSVLKIFELSPLRVWICGATGLPWLLIPNFHGIGIWFAQRVLKHVANDMENVFHPLAWCDFWIFCLYLVKIRSIISWGVPLQQRLQWSACVVLSNIGSNQSPLCSSSTW